MLLILLRRSKEMEHRLHKRAWANLSVELVKDGKLLGVGRTVEMSSGGVRITNPGLKFASDQVIDIKYIPISHPRTIVAQVRAMVVYCTSDYIGLMYQTEMPLSIFSRQIQRRRIDEESVST